MIQTRFAILTAAALLSGCNLVVTDKPLFTEADAKDSPHFRAGVWNGARPDCTFDETKPQKDWPKCANAEAPIPDPPPWLTAPGDPGVLQISAPPQGGSSASITLYVGYRATRTDAAGRVTELNLWPVQCGPPPPDSDKAGLTKHLLPGLTVRKDFGACTTDSKTALRNAARASEAWIPAKAMKTHWVRDPIPGDLSPDAKPLGAGPS